MPWLTASLSPGRSWKTAQAPPPPSPNDLDALATFELGKAPAPAKPAWAGALCKNRDAFQNAAIVIRGEGGDEHWKSHSALQSPHFASFSPMPLAGNSKDDYAPALTHAEWRRFKQYIWKMRFEIVIESIMGSTP